MDKLKAIYYIEHSFMAALINDKDVTDISYNGLDIYYVSNKNGRRKSDIIIEHSLAKDFIRQIANIAEKQFSYTNPYLDISVGKYRLHATHQSIGKISDEGVITFSIRIASTEARIVNGCNFFTSDIEKLIKIILSKGESIIIGGVTSSGKTEFQKYLLRNLDEAVRVIVIDNVLELDQVRNENLDLTCWQVDENNPSSSPGILIKNALRNNPDWLILAEARGEEMVDVLNSAMTGMPIITTLHSKDANSLPHRMGRMMMKSTQKIDYQDALQDIYYHFHYYFYLKKEVKDHKIVRYIAEINYVNSKGVISNIYQRKNNEHFYHHLPKDALIDFDEEELLEIKNTKFIGAKNE